MDIRPIDADNHYYEPLDAFTRHLDKAFKNAGRAPGAGRQARRAAHRRPGQPLHPQPDLRPDHRPGLPRPALPRADPRGREPGRAHARSSRCRPSTATATRASPSPTRRDSMRVLLFPTLGCGVEEALRHDIPATMASLSAFNRWLEDDWGFSYRDRLIAVPMLSLADPDAALARAGLADRARRAHGARPPRPRARPERDRAVARRQAARPGVGAPRRGVDPGRLPPRRQRLQRASPPRGARAPPSRASATRTS